MYFFMCPSWGGGVFFNQSNRIYHLNQDFALSLFHGEKPGVFLDLGCADLKLTEKIMQKIDPVETWVVDLSKIDDEKVKSFQFDLNEKFPFEDESVDVISANQIIEHIHNTDQFLKEIKRILKPGGYVVISTPNLSSVHSILFILLGMQTPVVHLTDIQVGNPLYGVKIDQPGHQKAFNKPAMKDLARYYGFEIEHLSSFGFYIFPNFLQKILSKTMARYGVYINARFKKPK